MRGRSKLLSDYKKTLKLSSLQKQTLIGILLGDGCLETQNNGRTYRLLIAQSEQHALYCDHLYSLFSKWVLTPPKISTHSNGLKVKKFKTISHSSFRFYGQQFYEKLNPEGSSPRSGGITGLKIQKRRKKLPKLIHRWLSARSLAYWFMDDGSWKSATSFGVILNTQNFKLCEVQTLCQILTHRWNLQCWPRKQKNKLQKICKKVYYQIYISGRSFKQFLKIIEPYLIDSMRYKLPPPYLKQIQTTQLPKK